MSKVRSELFKSVRKMVVKLGTRLVLDDSGRALHLPHMKRVVDQVCDLHEKGYQVVLVSSGAVGVGMGYLGLDTRPRKLDIKQACASIGQIQLVHGYFDLFRQRGKTAAQILVSGDDFRHRTRYHNIRTTMNTLLSRGVVPIVNENDTISTAEIEVGDNDKLSADVAHFLEADLLVILSDEDGLFDKNPKTHSDAKRVAVVPKVTPEILALGGKPGSRASVGGMKSKLEAIRQATQGGTPAVLTHGHRVDLIQLVEGGEIGTLFLPNPSRIRQGKRWMAFVARPKGRIHVDEGAAEALQKRQVSVLPAGVRRTRGGFSKGDYVEICALDGRVLGRGRSAYSASEVEAIKGRHSKDIASILGTKGPDEVIHRDHLVIY